MNKKAMSQIKAYFLIVNLVFAVVAFSWMVGAVDLKVDVVAVDGKAVPPKSLSNTNTAARLTSSIPDVSDVIVSIRTPVSLTVTEADVVTTFENVDGVDIENNMIHYSDKPSQPFSPETTEAIAAKLRTVKASQGVGWGESVSNYFTNNLLENLVSAAGIGAITAMIGGFAGGKDGAMWGFVSGFSGKLQQILQGLLLVKEKF